MGKKALYLVILFITSQIISLQAQEEKYITLFIYNFTKHFDWPATVKSGDFVIQVLGHKSVFLELNEFTAAKKVGNQEITVKSVTDISQVGRCHIIFVGHWQSRFLPEIIKKIGKHPTLIVTEKEGLLKQGSAINFVITGGSIQFEFKKKNASKYGIKFDPQIVKMAVEVYD